MTFAMESSSFQTGIITGTFIDNIFLIFIWQAVQMKRYDYYNFLTQHTALDYLFL